MPSRRQVSPTKLPSSADVKRLLQPLGTPERATREKAYLKSELTFLGVTVPRLRAEAKRLLLEHPEVTRSDVLAFASSLWASRVHELRSLAIFVLEGKTDVLKPIDLLALEPLLRQARTWAHVDELAAHVVGPLVNGRPSGVRVLERWQRDPDFWMRRTALLALLVPLREGAGDFDLFARWAETMLEDKEFFIRKAIGWVLRETAKKRPKLVYQFLKRNRARMSGLTLREARRTLPPILQGELQLAS